MYIFVFILFILYINILFNINVTFVLYILTPISFIVGHFLGLSNNQHCFWPFGNFYSTHIFLNDFFRMFIQTLI